MVPFFNGELQHPLALIALSEKFQRFSQWSLASDVHVIWQEILLSHLWILPLVHLSSSCSSMAHKLSYWRPPTIWPLTWQFLKDLVDTPIRSSCLHLVFQEHMEWSCACWQYAFHSRAIYFTVTMIQVLLFLLYHLVYIMVLNCDYGHGCGCITIKCDWINTCLFGLNSMSRVGDTSPSKPTPDIFLRNWAEFPSYLRLFLNMNPLPA